MKLNIAVLAGDGIGPEISAQGVAVMQAVCQKFGHEATFTPALVGAWRGLCVHSRAYWRHVFW